MRAVRLVTIGQPLQERDVPIPQIGDHDLLVRVRAAGICRSDLHYRAGTSPVGALPITPGHEVAGIVEAAGAAVSGPQVGDRVCLHYLVTCGRCAYCARGAEQFCVHGSMMGKHRDGGYAEYVAVPARNAVALPAEIPFEQGAIVMCSTSTSYHALRKGRFQAGERVAVFGLGGLGMSAVQLARALGALDVYAVDVNPAKLQLAESYGAIAVDAAAGDPVAQIRDLTAGYGVDLALEVIGLPQTMRQSVQCLAVFGRAVIAGIASDPLAIDTYGELLGREGEVMGTADHLLSELPLLLEFVRRGWVDLSQVVTAIIPLDAAAINGALDRLESFGDAVRTVIVPKT